MEKRYFYILFVCFQGDSGGPLNLRLNGTSMSTYEQVGEYQTTSF